MIGEEEQCFLLNRAYADMAKMKDNAIKEYRQNFLLLKHTVDAMRFKSPKSAVDPAAEECLGPIERVEMNFEHDADEKEMNEMLEPPKMEEDSSSDELLDGQPKGRSNDDFGKDNEKIEEEEEDSSSDEIITETQDVNKFNTHNTSKMTSNSKTMNSLEERAKRCRKTFKLSKILERIHDKAVENSKKYRNDNNALYMKLERIKNRPPEVNEAWNRHVQIKRTFLENKQRLRDNCMRHLRALAARDRQVLDRYEKRVAQIKRNRADDAKKVDLKNNKYSQFVDCADFIRILEDLSGSGIKTKPIRPTCACKSTCRCEDGSSVEELDESGLRSPASWSDKSSDSDFSTDSFGSSDFDMLSTYGNDFDMLSRYRNEDGSIIASEALSIVKDTGLNVQCHSKLNILQSKLNESPTELPLKQNKSHSKPIKSPPKMNASPSKPNKSPTRISKSLSKRKKSIPNRKQSPTKQNKTHLKIKKLPSKLNEYKFPSKLKKTISKQHKSIQDEFSKEEETFDSIEDHREADATISKDKIEFESPLDNTELKENLESENAENLEEKVQKLKKALAKERKELEKMYQDVLVTI